MSVCVCVLGCEQEEEEQHIGRTKSSHSAKLMQQLDTARQR